MRKLLVLLALALILPLRADGQTSCPAITDGVTVTGDGTTGNPITAITAPTQTDNVTLQGNGTSASKIAIKAVQVDGTTITGTGAVGSPLAAAVGGNSGIGGSKANNPGADNVYNVKNYGAVGNNSHDDTTAIQAAVNAAFAACNSAYNQTPSVFFPSGIFLITSPIILNAPGGCTIRLWGTGQNSSVLSAGNAIFPTVFIEPPNLVSTIGTRSGASLATGSGNSLQWTATQNYFYSLKDVQTGSNATFPFANAQPLNGLTAFSVEGFFNFPATGSNGTQYPIVYSSGREQGSVATTEAMNIYITQGTSTSTLNACTTVSTTGRVCTSGSITNATTYEFEFSYDGSNIRLFVGVPGSTTTLLGTTAATGTVVQIPAQTFLLGAKTNGTSPFNSQADAANSHFIGNLDSIRMSSVARHTAVYTAPTAKFGGGGGTFLLINGLSFPDDFLQVDSADASGGPFYMPAYTNTLLNAGSNYQIDNLYLKGGSYGLLSIGSLFGYIDHFRTLGTTSGVRMWNNNYGWSIRDADIRVSSFGEAPIAIIGSSGLNTIDHVHVGGGYYGMLAFAGAGGTFTNVVDDVSGSQLGGYYMGGTSQFDAYTMINLGLDNEANNTAPEMFIVGPGNYTCIACGLSASGSGAQLDLIVDSANVNNLTFIGSQFWDTNAATTNIIHIAAAADLLNPLNLQDSIVNGLSSYLIGNNECTSSGHPFACCTGAGTGTCPTLSDQPSVVKFNHPQCIAVANLPTAYPTGEDWCVSDWNGTDGTCTGGGSTYGTAVWSGSAWKCH